MGHPAPTYWAGGSDGALKLSQNAARFNAAFNHTFALHASQAVFAVSQWQGITAQGAVANKILLTVRARAFHGTRFFGLLQRRTRFFELPSRSMLGLFCRQAARSAW